MIDPTELTSTITGLGTIGFVSTVGLTYAVASTAQGLGTFGYTSTNQLLSTTIGVYGAIGSNIATTVQPQFISTVQGLGTAGYLSSTQILNTSKIVGLSSLVSYSYVTYNVTTPIASTSVPGIAVDKTNTYLYYGNGGYIYKYTLATGTATAFVGNGTNTFQDGTGTSAGLTSYGGALCIDPTNTIMYAFDGARIRKIILSSGVVTTIAGNGTSTGTAGTVDGTGTGATITYSRNTALNAAGTILYWMDYASNGVYLRQCVLSTGVVTTLAGRTGTTSINGYGLSACFGNNTQGLAIDSAGNIYISDLAIPGIRVYTPSDGYVSGGISGISQAGLSLCVDSFNQLWIPPWTPSLSGQIVVYNLTTRASFIVGSGYGPADGSQTVAQFGAITPIVADTLGSIYIGEFSAAGGYQNAVRFINATTNYSTIQVQGTFNVGTLIASAVTVGAISTLSISTGSLQTPLLSTLNINVSTINGQTFGQPINSTVIGLATAGYVSTTQLGSTVTNLITRIGAGGGGTSFVGSTTFLSATQATVSSITLNALSSVTGFVSTMYAGLFSSPYAYISSLQVDELQVGTGYGIIAFGDTNMSSLSTLGIAAGLGNFQTVNVSSINGLLPGTTFTGNLGTVSSLTALRFYGLTGTYTNTAVAEVSTGTGLQELLLYKVSSISDQVRVQTTGNVVFETGVSARGWPTANRITTPNFYIAGSNSNVGINTSNPLTTLDVAGTGRFQTLSSLNITAGSINYSVAFV
jgi:hypothetical protein